MALSRVAADQVTLGVSYSLSLADYRAVSRTLPHREMLPTPYAVCAGIAIGRILRRMADAPSRDVTLFVFEDGGIDHQQVRQIAAAEGIDHGEPVRSGRGNGATNTAASAGCGRSKPAICSCRRAAAVSPIVLSGAEPGTKSSESRSSVRALRIDGSRRARGVIRARLTGLSLR